MADVLKKGDLDDLNKTIIIVGAVVGTLSVISIVLGIVITVMITRVLRKLNALSITTQTTRLDVRKTLESVESSIKKNPVSIFDDDIIDGSEKASPIFTTSRMYTPSPISFNRLSRGDDYDRNIRRQGPPVPPKRAHSFYDGKNTNVYY